MNEKSSTRDLDGEQGARLAEALKRLRAERGWNQTEAAKEVDLSASGVNKIESGSQRGSIILALRVSAMLDQEPDEIMGRGWSAKYLPSLGAGRSEPARTIDSIEREWRDDGVFEEAIKLWRTRIEHATSSHTRPKITEAVRERDRIQGMIDAKMLDADGCIRIMQADIGDAQPTPPPYDPDDPGPPKRKAKT